MDWLEIAKWIIVGLIIGWIIEWIIDWIFWRRDDEQLRVKLNQAEAENNRLRAQAAEVESKLERLSQLERDTSLCRAKLAEAAATVDRLRGEFNSLALETPPEEDCFERIEGVGASFATQFNDAGMVTFAELADASPERVRQAVQPQAWQTVDAEGWIIRAREFARHKSDASQRIRLQYQESDQMRERIAELEATNSQLQAQLAAAEPASAGLGAAVAGRSGRAELGQLTATAPTRQIPVRHDNLEEIDGIGPTYAKRLNEAGIFSLAQLAQLTPVEIEAIIKPASWQKIDAESWIAQAKRLSRPDALEKIVGVGEVYANRLQGAGVHTFRQLAQLSPEHVREIINPEDWHNIDPDSWISQAKYLAHPDQLEEIDGIGEVYANRLNEAGVYSFEQLAELLPERIREIINPEEWQKIEPESWIAEAKAFAAKKALGSAKG